MKILLRPLAVLFALCLTTSAQADYGSSAAAGLSADTTAAAVAALEGGIATCQAVPVVYRFDCYRKNYGDAARSLGGNRDYGDAEQALGKVERVLRGIVRQNRDRDAPAISVGRKRYRAIKPEAVRDSAALFERARAEAVTVLLRAKGPAQTHYARIASVVGSDKVILRSGLMRLRRLA